MEDPFDLRRFLIAQEDCYPAVVAELRAGRKETHWMWFIFPQLRGLGSSAASRRYGISGLDEAAAYWSHHVLGARLRECVGLLLAIRGLTAQQILGSPDDLKLRSSLTLFSEAAPEDGQFPAALERYFAGASDQRTLALLRAGG